VRGDGGGLRGALALVLVLLYFPCAWYARVKREQAKWWMSYL
jgi:hypothetical protein